MVIYIGIDTGVHTGFAVWHSDTKYLAEVSTMTITQAMEREIDEEIERVNKILQSRRSPWLNFNEQ